VQTTVGFYSALRRDKDRKLNALEGLKVLELGQLIAGPFAGKTLAEFGADVIKVEPHGVGDPLRKWRLLRDGTSVWWEVQSRNKRSVCLDLRSPEGQESVRALALEGRRADRKLQARHARGLGPRLGATARP
jgi:formyl-CoA transferase